MLWVTLSKSMAFHPLLPLKKFPLDSTNISNWAEFCRTTFGHTQRTSLQMPSTGMHAWPHCLGVTSSHPAACLGMRTFHQVPVPLPSQTPCVFRVTANVTSLRKPSLTTYTLTITDPLLHTLVQAPCTCPPKHSIVVDTQKSTCVASSYWPSAWEHIRDTVCLYLFLTVGSLTTWTNITDEISKRMDKESYKKFTL